MMGATGQSQTSAQRQGNRIRTKTVRYGYETSTSSEVDHDFSYDFEEISRPYTPMTPQPKRQIVVCTFADTVNQKKLRTLLTQPQKKLDNASRSTNVDSKKRKSTSSNATDVDEYEPAIQNTDKSSKRQRRPTAKERAESRAMIANIQNSFPEPRGQPEVWADVSNSP